ncbi:MAG: hypothetical protein KDD56_07660 [Bdellovibrionales bacterium]|nr:hypothetical protein [Bdellovibrionales bacterium]
MKNFKKYVFILIASVVLGLPSAALCRDVEYKGGEVSVYIRPGEPTQIQFPEDIQSGYKRKQSALSIDKKGRDLVVFASDTLVNEGEAIIVRLNNGRSYSLRILKSDDQNLRDALVKIADDANLILSSEEEVGSISNPISEKASAQTVSGLLREMILVAEFGKTNIQGYRVSNQYKGETVLNDGTIEAKIDKIFMGPKYWGYVMDAANKLGVSQKLNAATFRLDGTRAISAERWELSPTPLNIEEQIAGSHKAKVYVITKARSS